MFFTDISCALTKDAHRKNDNDRVREFRHDRKCQEQNSGQGGMKLCICICICILYFCGSLNSCVLQGIPPDQQRLIFAGEYM